ncbi:MAG: thiamine pyrophosphate-binding protein [Spirochaetota bacterium]
MHGGNVIANVLHKQDITHLFTLCGGHIAPILTAAEEAGIHVTDVRHEASAVFAADAIARLSGTPGIAVVTAGPGVTNAVTALQNALMAQSPVILIAGAAPTVLQGRGALQDIDQLAIVKPVVKKSYTIKKNCDLAPVLENAFAVASSGVPGPVFVEIPIDVLYEEELVRSWYGTAGTADTTSGSHSIRAKIMRWYLNRHVDTIFSCDLESLETGTVDTQLHGISNRLVRKAARTIFSSSQPVMIVGSQAMLDPGRVSQLKKAVEEIQVPVYLTGMARGLLDEGHPLLMRHKRSEVLKRSDCVILAGMPADFRLEYGRKIPNTATLISVNRSRKDLKMNRKPNIGIHSDPFLFLHALSGEFSRTKISWISWNEEIHQLQHEREQHIMTTSREKTGYINPLYFLMELKKHLGEDDILVADGGDFVASASYILHPPTPLSWLDPGVFGTLGVGGGFALGAAAARPGKTIWILYGDGAAGYSLMEMDTFARHGIPVIAVIGNDAGWQQIARDQVEYLGNNIGTQLTHAHYNHIAEAFGGKGYEIRNPRQVKGTLEKAKKASRKGMPVLVNVHIGTTDFRKGSISM